LHILRNPLWVMRFLFFLWLGGNGFLLPFLQIFYQEHGLSGFEIGILSSIGFLVGMLVALWIGRRSEDSGRPIRWLQISLLLSIGTTLLLGRQTAFYWMIPVVALNALAGAAQGPIAGALALRATQGTRSGYGSIRVWGSLGWSILVLIAGIWIQRSGIQVAFYGFAAAMLCAWGITLLWQQPAPAAPSIRAVAAGNRNWGFLFRSRSLMVFLFALLITLFAMSGVRQFENLYLKGLGAGEQLIGLAATLAAVVELPGMFLADWLTRKVGAEKVLTAAFFLEGLTRGCVLLSPSVGMIIGVKMLTGISFSMAAVATMGYIQKHIPSERQPSAVAFYTIVVVNLVSLVVAPLSGLVFDSIGPYWLYAVALGGNLLGGIFLLLGNRRIK
jgi:MFS transporter, PPP family, 3-phenylpropionic acid transporter